MKWAFLLGIRAYWLVPARMRRACLFKESCSRYVYRITCLEGVKGGIRALQERRKQCCPGFYLLSDGNVRLADGSVVPKGLTRLDTRQ